MAKKAEVWLSFLMLLAFIPTARAQDKAQPAKPGKQAAAPPAATPQEKNVKEYIQLLRENVRQEKAELMGAVMRLSAHGAAKFWPIYAEYETELTKVNDLRVANIEEYARTYNDMTDEKADQLIQNAMQYQKMRSDLLAKYYERVKQSLGAITAARFVQVENQLLLIIDLQIDSSLPLVQQGS